MGNMNKDFTCLDRIQSRLQSIYGVDVPFSVSDFVITDEQLMAQLIDGDKVHLRERLLVRQEGEDVDLSLFLHQDVVDGLISPENDIPFTHDYIQNLCFAIEGISHFLYLVWRALQNRQVSMLELELQAEVDKYVLLLSLLDRQNKHTGIFGLREKLFENVQYDSELNDAERFRYEEANYYAAKYCYQLESRFRSGEADRQMKSELREFYRLPQHAKFSKIDSPVF